MSKEIITAKQAIGIALNSPNSGPDIGISIKTQQEKFQPSDIVIIKNSLTSQTNFLIQDMSDDAIFAMSIKIRKQAIGRLGIPQLDKYGEAEQYGYIANSIKAKPLLTYNEVMYVVDKGLSGGYIADGEKSFVHFSATNLSIWLKTHEDQRRPVISEYKKRKQAEDNARAEEEKRKAIPSDEELRQEFFKTVNSQVREVIESPGKSILAFSYHYESLVKYGLYETDEEEFNEAKKIVASEISVMGPGMKVATGNVYAQIYKNYIKSLAEFRVVLDKNGNQVEIESLQ